MVAGLGFENVGYFHIFWEISLLPYLCQTDPQGSLGTRSVRRLVGGSRAAAS